MRNKFKLSFEGVGGNAYALMDEFRGGAKRAGWTPKEINALLDKAMEGDYDNLIQTMMKAARK